MKEDKQIDMTTSGFFAVGSEMLRPGESTQYSGSTRAKGVSECRAVPGY